MKQRSWLTPLVILALSAVSLLVALPAGWSLPEWLPAQIRDRVSQVPSLTLPILGNDVTINPPLKQGLDIKGGMQVVLQAEMAGIPEAERETALAAVREVMARRVDLYGISEPLIQTARQADQYRLIVELPGVDDSAQALQLIGTTAELDFRLIEFPETESETATAGAVLAPSFTPTGLTGQQLQRASVQFSQGAQGQALQGQPLVSLEFKPDGAELFRDITTQHQGEMLAIFLDGVPVTTPVIQEPILNGQASITGNFDIETAKGLAIQLNAGALPVPIKVIEQRSVGASLGQASVKASVQAGLIGLGLVMMFMIMYYGVQGLLASMALLVYSLLTLAVYKSIGVTLSLPGIAGLLLSIGMAVDANILIFERFKEELRDGKPFSVAMELGFGKAWDSIKDANLATIMTALVLINPLNFTFLNTSGLVRGFGVTLLIGVLISLFTGVVVTRTLLRWFLRPSKSDLILKQTKFRQAVPTFMKHRGVYAAISLAVIVPGMVNLALVGLKPAIDFTGGSLLELQFEQPVSQVESPEFSTIQPTGPNQFVFRGKELSNEQKDQLVAQVEQQYGPTQELRFETVGPVLGRELIQKTLVAVVLVSSIITLYVWYQFKELRFGVSAIFAMFHDTLVVVAVYSLLGRWFGAEVDVLFVTAILTTLSFSVHDTIVVFDRIRETRAKFPRVPLSQLVDAAVLETLGRSLNNSLTIIVMLLSLVWLGGDTLRWFATTLLLGAITGTYSSSFTAAPMLIWWDDLNRLKNRLSAQK